MTLIQQILWGGFYLAICLLLQVGFLAVAEVVLNRFRLRLKNAGTMRYVVTIFCLALVFIVASHTAQVWIWAFIFMFGDVLSNWNEAVYFSLVTYTSLGYGDILLGPEVRIFAVFATVTGMLGFGISSAYLVALVARLPTGVKTG